MDTLDRIYTRIRLFFPEALYEVEEAVTSDQMYSFRIYRHAATGEQMVGGLEVAYIEASESLPQWLVDYMVGQMVDAIERKALLYDQTLRFSTS